MKFAAFAFQSFMLFVCSGQAFADHTQLKCEIGVDEYEILVDLDQKIATVTMNPGKEMTWTSSAVQVQTFPSKIILHATYVFPQWYQHERTITFEINRETLVSTKMDRNFDGTHLSRIKGQCELVVTDVSKNKF